MVLVKRYYECDLEDVKEHLKSGIVKIDGYKPDTDEIFFYCKDGFVVKMYHDQDCCECVQLECADGLVNEEDVFTGCDWCEIEAVSSEGVPGKGYTIGKYTYEPDSYTWTFYKFRTNKGYDFMRWYGESNGYYSESVDFEIYKID